MYTFAALLSGVGLMLECIDVGGPDCQGCKVHSGVRHPCRQSPHSF